MLADALQNKQNRVRKLNLWDNRIGDVGATRVACMLATNHVLQDLNLKFNGIGPVGASAVASALKVNTALLRLNLSFGKLQVCT